MSQTVECRRQASPVPADPQPLPPDLEALLTSALHASKARVGLIIPPGCGKIPVALAYADRRKAPALLLAANAPTAALWADRWQEECSEASPAFLSRDLQCPAAMTVSDREALSRGSLRDLLAALRSAGIATIVVDEPYDLPRETLEILERVCESLPGVHVLSLAAYPPYHLSLARRAEVEEVCGAPTDALDTAALVRRGVLSPHRDFLYLCEPPAVRVKERRSEQMNRIASLPFMANPAERLARQGEGYLLRHHEDLVAIAAWIRLRNPKGAARLMRLLGEASAPPPLTNALARRAMAYMLTSRAFLSADEKKQLQELPPSETEERSPDAREQKEARKATAAGTIQGIERILAAEENTLGSELRVLVMMPGESSQATDTAFSSLLTDMTARRGGSPTAVLQNDHVILPDGMVGRLCRFCGDAIERRPVREGYTACYAAHADALLSALEQLFGTGELRMLLCTATPEEPYARGTERLGRMANVLILPILAGTDETQLHRARVLMDLRGRMLRTSRDVPRRVVHIWHTATFSRAFPQGERETDEHAAMQARLRCLPTATALFESIPSTPSGREARNAALLTAARDRRATVDAFRRAATEKAGVQVAVELSYAVKLPNLTPRQLVGVILSLPAMGIGGFLLRHLIALTLQARGMPAVLAIFAGLTLVAASMTAWGVVYNLKTLPFLWRHRTARASAQSMVHALLRALKQADRIGHEITATVTASPAPRNGAKGGRRLTVTFEQAEFADADCAARALCELLSPIREPRYILRRSASVGRNGTTKKKPAAVFACPHVLAERDASAATFAACMRRPLGRVELIYTRRSPGDRRLMEAKAWGYLNRAGENAACRAIIHPPARER